MRITIDHRTVYRFDQPVWHGVKRLRLTPRDTTMQTVLDWDVAIEGGAIECSYEDHHQNTVTLATFGSGAGEITIRCRGTVETRDTAGVLGAHSGFMPLWHLASQTEWTRPGPRLKALVSGFRTGGQDGQGQDVIAMLHALMAAVGGAVAYTVGETGAHTTAEDALAAGVGVCQDHAHVFIGAARALGLPARYVSGYLLMPDREVQEAGHAWAEVFVAGLGWVGFDVSNAKCPDEHYVRVAVGTDFRDAAPVKGVTQGGGMGDLSVALHVVAQQMVAQ